MSTEAFVYEAIRTPRGRGKKTGSLHSVKPISLLVGLIDELKQRHPNVDTNVIDDVVLGVVSPVGDQGAVIARTAADRGRAAAHRRRRPAQPVLRVGPRSREHRGAEGPRGLGPADHRRWRRVDVAGADGLRRRRVVPRPRDQLRLLLRSAGRQRRPDRVTIEGFSREDVDAYAVESQNRAAKAWESGYFAKAVVPVKDRNGITILDHDEHMRPGSTVESLGKLGPSFEGIGEMGGFDAVALQKYHMVEKINHVHTAANSSGIVDGAALVLVGNEKIGEQFGIAPRARIVSTATTGSEPTIMLTGPTPAAEKALRLPVSPPTTSTCGSSTRRSPPSS